MCERVLPPLQQYHTIIIIMIMVIQCSLIKPEHLTALQKLYVHESFRINFNQHKVLLVALKGQSTVYEAV